MSLKLCYQSEQTEKIGDCYWTLAMLKETSDDSWWMGVRTFHSVTHDVHDSEPARLDAADVDEAWADAQSKIAALMRATLGLAPSVT
jgi:hypothetical protein